MEKICIYPEQGAEITAYERALNCLIFMLVYLLAGILCMFLPVIFGIHACYIGWCVAAGSFFWTAILLWATPGTEESKEPPKKQPIKEVLQDKADEKKAQRTAPAQAKHRQQDMEL